MNEVEGFDKQAYPLHRVAVHEWEGFLFLNLDPAAVAGEQWFAPLQGRFASYNLPLLHTVRRIEYDVRANWKLVLQNYNECLHCPTIHPELSTKLPYTSGANDFAGILVATETGEARGTQSILGPAETPKVVLIRQVG